MERKKKGTQNIASSVKQGERDRQSDRERQREKRIEGSFHSCAFQTMMSLLTVAVVDYQQLQYINKEKKEMEE